MAGEPRASTGLMWIAAGAGGAIALIGAGLVIATAIAGEPEKAAPVPMIAAPVIAVPAPLAPVAVVEPETPAPREELRRRARKRAKKKAVRADYGVLHIRADVDVEVYVDGAKLGRAPERDQFPLFPGTHELRATRTNCAPDVRAVKIRAGKTTRVYVKNWCR